MKNNHIPLRQRTISIKPTKAEKLYTVLLDRAWHATQELVAKVGHTFAVALHHLRRLGYAVDKRRHCTRRRTFEYRLGNTGPRSAKAPDDLPVEGFGKR